MSKWLYISEYATKQGITPQGVYRRIKQGHISNDRVRIAENGRKQVLEEVNKERKERLEG